jgi:hypothetical protein
MIRKEHIMKVQKNETPQYVATFATDPDIWRRLRTLAAARGLRIGEIVNKALVTAFPELTDDALLAAHIAAGKSGQEVKR